ncbi:nucleolar protein 56 isoform X2 [Rhea pennata]|uniref:nucleolar protein 56 isoform X2 n=1 Tax=Rhea pennata TaxID=8795 RepID=UPI002E252F3D
MVLLHALFEHAAGYALFAVREVEEISLLLPQVEESVLSVGKFHNVVKLVAFSPFKSAQSALENMNAVSEGVLHEDLRLLLETHMPAKKRKALLGVADAKIGAAILEELGYQCQTGGVVAEILRGIRLHFHALVKGLTAQSASKAQLGLGHSYSRAKVKFNVNRVDNMIIQSISLLDQLDKDINTFSMRVREWYGYHFPELIKIVSENYTYCRLAKFIGNRKELSEESLEGLEEIVMDSAKAQAILEASRSSMGMDISPIDLINIESFSSRVISLSEYRKGLQEYLRSKMSQVAPSLSALIGEVVGARLISHAGSLTNLAKYPASTVQILGAEKALFSSTGRFQGAEDAREHAKVRAHFSLHLHRASGRQEQGAHLPLPGQQVHDRLQDRLLLRGAHERLWGQAPGAGGGAAGLLRDRGAAAQEPGGHEGGHGGGQRGGG